MKDVLISSLTCEFARDGQCVSSVVIVIDEATRGQGKLVAAACRLLCLTATMWHILCVCCKRLLGLWQSTAHRFVNQQGVAKPLPVSTFTLLARQKYSCLDGDAHHKSQMALHFWQAA